MASQDTCPSATAAPIRGPSDDTTGIVRDVSEAATGVRIPCRRAPAARDATDVLLLRSPPTTSARSARRAGLTVTAVAEEAGMTHRQTSTAITRRGRPDSTAVAGNGLREVRLDRVSPTSFDRPRPRSRTSSSASCSPSRGPKLSRLRGGEPGGVRRLTLGGVEPRAGHIPARKHRGRAAAGCSTAHLEGCRPRTETFRAQGRRTRRWPFVIDACSLRQPGDVSHRRARLPAACIDQRLNHTMLKGVLLRAWHAGLGCEGRRGAVRKTLIMTNGRKGRHSSFTFVKRGRDRRPGPKRAKPALNPGAFFAQRCPDARPGPAAAPEILGFSTG